MPTRRRGLISAPPHQRHAGADKDAVWMKPTRDPVVEDIQPLVCTPTEDGGREVMCHLADERVTNTAAGEQSV